MISYFRFKVIDILRRTKTLEALKFLISIEFLDESKIKKISNEKLDNYLRELRKSSTIYKNLEFSEFPIIDKAFANKNRIQLQNKGHQGIVYRKKTGGSTGEPFLYMTGAESQSYLWGAILLSWKTAGYKLGDPVIFLAGSSIYGSSLKQTIFYKLMNVKTLSAFNMTEENIKKYLIEIKRVKAVIVYGYASAIHRLAQYILCHSSNQSFSLRGVVCTAENLTDGMRGDIERAFGVPCYSQYGCNDAGVSAYECERRDGYHLITTRCYPEVISDGRLISTDMTNTALFLPRYDTGDIVEMSNCSCPCGRGFPLIKRVVGRSNDLVIDRNNKAVHSEFFSHLFREDSLIKSFQITFDTSELTVNLHTENPESDWQHYLDVIRSQLVFKKVNLVINQPFLKLKNGKVRAVMCLENVEP